MVGILVGVAIMQFVEFFTYLLAQNDFGYIVLSGFLAMWLVILLLDFGSFVWIKHLQHINYQTIDVKYKADGKNYTLFKNIEEYEVDNFGRMTFKDSNGIIYYTIHNWKIIGHSEK